MERHFLLRFVALALGANLVWEGLHYRLYDTPYPSLLNPWTAALCDCLLLTGFYLLGTRIFHQDGWHKDWNFKKSGYVLGIGLFGAIFIELVATRMGLWTYTPYMPLAFGFGISPLLQLPATMALSIFLGTLSEHSVHDPD